jgi:hypothetical protein
MTQTLLMEALTAAYWKKKPAPGLMHHSDAGNSIATRLTVHYKLVVAYKHQSVTKVIVATMHRYKAYMPPSEQKACIMIVLKPERLLSVSSLSILKYFIIAFGDMQK